MGTVAHLIRGYWKELLGLRIVLGYFRGTFMRSSTWSWYLKEAETVL